MSKPPYTLRQACKEDYDFLYELHAVTMRPYVEVLWGWEEAWQQEYFARKFDPQIRQVIIIDDQDAGVLVVQECDAEIYVGLIEIAPQCQGRGVGTAVLHEIMRLAEERNQPVTLHVLKSNKPARRLYERLGFVVTSEEDYRFQMAYLPGNSTEREE